MRRHLTLVTAVLAALALPAAASAKEVTRVDVCGARGACSTYDRSDFKSLTFLANDAGPTDPPRAAAPWYRIRFTVDEGANGGGVGLWTVAYVPSAGKLRTQGEGGAFRWAAVAPEAAAVLGRAARRLPALPAARLRGLPAGTYEPARRASTTGGTSWGWIAGGAVAAALLATAVVVLRGRRGPGVAPT